MAVVRGPFLLVLLILVSFSDISLGQYSVRVQNCTSGHTIAVGDYFYSGFPNVPICPLSNISGVSWVYDLSETATVYHSSTTDFSPSEICVHHDTNSSYLFFLKPFVTNSGKGKLSFQIRKDFGNSMLNVSFAPKGLFLTHSSSATLRVTEGELVQFNFIFLLYHPGNPKPTETQFIYKRTASGGFISPNGSVVLVFGLARIGDYCYLDDTLTSPTGAITPRPQPYGVSVRNPNVNDSGNYSVVVPYDGTNYTANFTIIVLPIETTTSSSTMMDSSSIIMSSSVTPSAAIITTTSASPTMSNSMSTSPTPGGGILGVYVFLGFLGFICILVISIAIVLGLCCYWRIKNHNGTSQIATEEVRARSEDNFYADHDVDNEKKEIHPRADSTGSNKPLLQHSGRLSSTSSASNARQDDYTLVYCDKRHSHIGAMWKEKHKEKFVIATTDQEIISSMDSPSCCEVFIYADPQDLMLRSVLSRGFPNNREKLKWWHFVHDDKTPGHLIEVGGIRVVQVQGDPNDFDTLQLGMLKTEYPVLNHKNAVIEETFSNGYTTSNPQSSSCNTGTGKRPIDETDGVTTSTANGRDPIMNEILEEHRKTNRLLTEMKETAEKQLETSIENTKTNKAALSNQEESVVVDPASSEVQEDTV